jgi:hypothetical protein
MGYNDSIDENVFGKSERSNNSIRYSDIREYRSKIGIIYKKQG